ncbi:MAG: hypothetical protein HRT38_14470 [Alteromonadaceae bacterium]|nr:hypothetical protein [Alteromonadaceae bacterium]NQY64903.1 hypothetical protein [Alteromonadaceae bacterium]
MNKFNFTVYTLFTGLIVSLSACQLDNLSTKKNSSPINSEHTLTNSMQLKDCSFKKSGSWWKQNYEGMPANVANNSTTGEPEFCEFYQFAQDWFLYLISPDDQTGLANWESQLKYPLLETTGTDSCDKIPPPGGHALNIRTDKSKDDSEDFVIPERIDQASAEAIYDQDGYVVFYEIKFSKNLCDIKNIQSKPNFPGKTVELKIAWRVLDKDDGDNFDDYYRTTAIIDSVTYTLGLIGWHIVVAADNHPEFVWITLDHKNNAVVCDDIGPNQTAYDFTNKACAQDNDKCSSLNTTLQATDIKLPSTRKIPDICQTFPYGTFNGDLISKDDLTNDGLNIELIKKLNKELQENIFGQTGLPTSLPVWKNYQFTGALWISDIKENAIPINQRGSLELANTVMETGFQGTPGVAGSSLNCFGCHSYKGTATGKSNTESSSGLSHIFDDIIKGQKKYK